MQEASEKTVIGNFENASFTHFGVTSTFFKRDGRFFVRTDGPDGTLREYQIAYTFGIFPLQQYLIAFPGGRFQALNVCWDTRPAKEGGSAGSTSIRRKRSRTTIPCTGPAPTRTGTSCAPSATRPT